MMPTRVFTVPATKGSSYEVRMELREMTPELEREIVELLAQALVEDLRRHPPGRGEEGS